MMGLEPTIHAGNDQMAIKTIEDFDLETNQVGELQMLTSKQMVFKIAGWMAEKGVRPTQTDVGRLIHRHTGQTPSKTTLKEALDSFYAQALQTAVTRQSVGQIPSEMVDRLEAIYLQIKEACQLEFASERQSFIEVEEFLQQRIAEIDKERMQALATLSERDSEIEAMKRGAATGETQRLALEQKVESLQQSFTDTWKEKIDLENALAQSKQSFEAQVRQINAERQAESDALKIAHQEEVKSASIAHAAELKKLGEANHAQTTRLLLKIDEVATEAKKEAEQAEARTKKLSEQLDKVKGDRENYLELLRIAKAEAAELRAQIGALQDKAGRVPGLEQQLGESQVTIKGLTESIARLSATIQVPAKARQNKEKLQP